MKKNSYKITGIFLLLILLGAEVFPQLNGTYTIGGASPDFVSFTKAVDSLNFDGVTGPVIFNVRDGSYDEQITINEINGASATNTITFQSENGDSTKVELSFDATSGDNYTIRLYGADYIIFRQISVSAKNTSNGRVIFFFNRANNNQFLNSVLTGISTTSPSQDFAIIFSSTYVDSNNVFKYNVMNNGSYGIFFYGKGTANEDLEKGTIVENNTFNDQSYMAVRLFYQDAPLVSGNVVSNSASYSTYVGLYVAYGSNNLIITKNYLDLEICKAGIWLDNGNSALGKEGLIANNIVSISDNSLSYGLYCSSSKYQNFYFNSVNITNASSSAAFNLENSFTKSINLVNNNLINTGGGYAIKLDFSYGILKSDHNNYLSSGTYLAYWNKNIADLSSLQSENNMDSNSISLDPLYISDTDLHMINSTAGNRGLPIVGITEDFDGDIRSSSNPDIGADEFTPLPNDAGIYSIDSPGYPFCSLDSSVILKIRNNGSDTLVSVTIEWSVNDTMQVSYNWTDTLSPESISDTIHIAKYAFSPGDSLKIWTSKPNGNSDTIKNNDTLVRYGIYPALGGEYTIGDTLADYKNFTEAVKALNMGGVCDSVIFNVKDGTYNEQIEIGQLIGISSSRDVTFQSEGGDSSKVILSYSSLNSNNNYVIKLNGSDYIRFKNMTIFASDVSFAQAIYFLNEAGNNEFSNCVIKGNKTNLDSPYLYVIHSDPSTNNNYNIFRNNLIQYGSYGMYLIGFNNNNEVEKSIIIENNQFLDQYKSSIYIQNHDAPQIKYNTFLSDSSSNSYLRIYGYAIQNDLKIMNNRILGNNGGYGIELINCNAQSSAIGLISNNFIHIGGDTGDVSYGIYLSNCDYQKIIFNSVNVTGKDPDKSFGLYVINGIYNVSKNNIIANKGGGKAIYLNPKSPVPLQESDYNNLFTSGSSLGSYNNLPQLDLNEWKSGVGLDQNSISVDPLFYSVTDLHVCQDSLNKAGISVNTITTDLEGDVRNANLPDIGADEFEPLNNVQLNNDTSVCKGAFVLLDAGVISGTYSWSTGATSQTILVTDSGQYNVTGSSFCGSESDKINIYFRSTPVSDFTYTTSFFTAIFKNVSKNASSYLWSFGDGNSSNYESPSHVYVLADTFPVSLTAINECANDTFTQNVIIKSIDTADTTGIFEVNYIKSFDVFPNPSNGEFQINISLLENKDLEVSIFNILGEKIYDEDLKKVISYNK
ncbi:right-handed parallel beta-helix repeat-containing protein, partial [Bacteroidales bacterium AH-315-N07]|nr:right-handed parallel beta-helix repeat-containing protein [Bacteroidales bacterium AH-315-N07]